MLSFNEQDSSNGTNVIVVFLQKACYSIEAFMLDTLFGPRCGLYRKSFKEKYHNAWKQQKASIYKEHKDSDGPDEE